MADIYGLPVQRLELLAEATSFGAALAGGIGLGLYPGFELAQKLTPVIETTLPDLILAPNYERLYDLFTRAYRLLIPLYEELNPVSD